MCCFLASFFFFFHCSFILVFLSFLFILQFEQFQPTVIWTFACSLVVVCYLFQIICLFTIRFNINSITFILFLHFNITNCFKITKKRYTKVEIDCWKSRQNENTIRKQPNKIIVAFILIFLLLFGFFAILFFSFKFRLIFFYFAVWTVCIYGPRRQSLPTVRTNSSPKVRTDSAHQWSALTVRAKCPIQRSVPTVRTNHPYQRSEPSILTNGRNHRFVPSVQSKLRLWPKNIFI